MEGIILNYNEDAQEGILRSDEGVRYQFSKSSWNSEQPPNNGQRVDFVTVENGFAVDVYPIIYNNIILDLSSNFKKLRQNKVVSHVEPLFSNGMHNKVGAYLAVAMLISLYLPVISMPMLGSISLSAGIAGTLIFIVLVLLAIAYYGGVSRKYTQYLTLIFLLIVAYQYFDIFSSVDDFFTPLGDVINKLQSLGGIHQSKTPHLIDMLAWGIVVNVVLMGLLLAAAYSLDYKKGEAAF